MTEGDDRPKTLTDYQQEVREWADRNFPNAKMHPYWCLLGAQEELGELCHAILKSEQGIRAKPGNSAKWAAEAQDAIADLIIYLLHYCAIRMWNMDSILSAAWSEVKNRDWLKYPETGRPPEDKA